MSSRQLSFRQARCSFWEVVSGHCLPAAQPRVVEVPAGPAFVQLPGASEINARSGQSLKTNALLRTAKPGRMQVMLGNGRQFRMGVMLSCAWVIRRRIVEGIPHRLDQAGTPRLNPFTIKTRLATASIQGTTVSGVHRPAVQSLQLGHGAGGTSNGRRFTLTSGQQLFWISSGRWMRSVFVSMALKPPWVMLVAAS